MHKDACKKISEPSVYQTEKYAEQEGIYSLREVKMIDPEDSRAYKGGRPEAEQTFRAFKKKPAEDKLFSDRCKDNRPYYDKNKTGGKKGAAAFRIASEKAVNIYK